MNGPLRIFHVVGNTRGARGERFLLQAADHLDPQLFRMAVALTERGPLSEELRRRHIPFEVVSLSPLGNPLPVRALSRLFLDWKPNLIQAHGARSNFYARLAAGRIPCISTVHNSLSDYPISALRRGLYLAADRLTAARSAAVVCAAECLRVDFLRRCPSLWERTYVIPDGVDLERFDPRRHDRELIRQTLGLGDRWTLLLIGRMTEQKGHAVLLEAVSRIKNVLPPFRILFAGEGPQKEFLTKKSHTLDLHENTVFLGGRRDIPELLSASDVVVLPSVSEGVPYVLLEALAMGKTVILSNVNGVSELMPNGDEGYLVPPGSPEKLTEALLKTLWDKQDARERAGAGRRRVQQDHDLKKILAKWETLYHELAGDLLIN